MEEEIKKEEQIAESIPKEETELETCQKKCEEYLDGWKRAKADLANYKKEERQHFEKMIKFGNETIISDLLIVLDSFTLGRKAVKDNHEAEEGLRIIQSQCEEILKKFGLKRIEGKMGDLFNPAEHEAIGEMNSEAPPGTISEIIETGFKLHEKVLRPAKVMISKEQTSKE